MRRNHPTRLRAVNIIGERNVGALEDAGIALSDPSRGGRKGAAARQAAMTPRQRSALGKAGAKARWG